MEIGWNKPCIKIWEIHRIQDTWKLKFAEIKIYKT